MKKFIHIEDLENLLRIFFPKEISIRFQDSMEFLDKEYKSYRSMLPGGDRLLIQCDSVVDQEKIKNNAPEYIFSWNDTSSGYAGYEFLDYGYINNPDGSVRWLFFQKNKNARFLNFYAQNSLRAKCIAFGLKTAYALGGKKLISNGNIRVYFKKDYRLYNGISDLKTIDHSLFLGTKGWSRTALLEYGRGTKSSHFIKMPLNSLGERLVKREKEALKRSWKKYDNVSVPELLPSGYLEQCKMKNGLDTSYKRASIFTELHADALVEIFNKTSALDNERIGEWYRKLKNNIAYLLDHKKPEVKRFGELLNTLEESLRKESQCWTSSAHGDFTSWNMYVGKKDIYVYDWELYQSQAPALFDFFHYHIQGGIIEGRSDGQILEAIRNGLKYKAINNLVESHHLNVDHYFHYYILFQAALQLPFISDQYEMTREQKRLIQRWEGFLLKWEKTSLKGSYRQYFIEEFHSRLQSTSHAHLKFIAEDLRQLSLSSDLDILVLESEQEAILEFCSEHVLIEKYRVIRKSFMQTIQLYFKDGSFLSLDLIHKLVRKQLQFMDVKQVLKFRELNKFNISKPLPKYDIEYCLLFYTLNGSDIPVRYKEYYQTKLSDLRKVKIFNYLKTKYNLSIHSFDSLFSYSEQTREDLNLALKTRSENKNHAAFSLKCNYILDTVRDLIFRKGFIISLSGVDGAGKTTVLGKMENLLKSKYRKDVVVMRHRPNIFPMLNAFKIGKEAAEKKASVDLPRQGKNKSFISSIFRFSYYYLDYLLGQLYVYFKYVLKGKIVLYDRYYFDFINDSRRSNIQLNKWIVKQLYFFIWKPRLNYLLYADPDLILRRKQELQKEDINALTISYKKLFHQYDKKYSNSHYCLIENRDLEKTLKEMEFEFLKVV